MTLKSNTRFICLLIFLFLTGRGFSQQTFTVSGTITNAQGTPVEDIAVIASGATVAVDLTDASGVFSFDLPAGGEYEIRPYSNCNVLNGVSTLDLVLLDKVISGIDTFDSPYTIIAGDVNPDAVLDTFDLVDIRAVIVGGWPLQFPNNVSWRFVPADYVFPDPGHPFPYPQAIDIPSLSSNQSNVNFIAIKIGDVSYSALPAAGICNDLWPSALTGKVRIDDGADCLPDTVGAVLEDWLLLATNDNNEKFYSKTLGDGSYSIPAPAGNYSIKLQKPNTLWDVCVDEVSGVALSSDSNTTVDFQAFPNSLCPYMEVALSAPFLRRCFDNEFTVFYCNKGTSPATDAYVEVTFDTLLTVLSSTLPWTSVNGNTYTFDLGEVAAGDCGSIKVLTNLSCDAVLGQTHCSEAHIFPDTLCVAADPLWNGANLTVSGNCQNGDVIFTITNTGEDMTDPVQYIVIEDIMIQMSGQTDILGNGQSQSITLSANGSTWRIEVPQVPNNPWTAQVNAFVEGCGLNGNGDVSLGYATLYPLNGNGPGTDIFCRENIGAFDPNDKQGFPRGVYAEHYIPKDAEIEYMIRFQNTGTDTAFSIVILDTLSSRLDPATLRMGASSHPYQYNITGPGILQVAFSNIMLPDSNINEPASHGYFTFSIKPVQDVPDQSVIENSAAIYFDFNDPVITNKTWHTVGEKYLSVSNVILHQGIRLQVYPNPAVHAARFTIDLERELQGNVFLYDLQGRQVKTKAFSTNVFDLDVNNLNEGMYFFRLETQGGTLATGKMLVSKGK